MFELRKTWQMDPRLAADTIEIATLGESKILLMNDKRWPWVIVVPMINNAEELHDLAPGRRESALQLACHLGENLKAHTGCEKINIAALGNIVRQLHIHVVARSENDPNWPAPVWGYGVAERYSKAEAQALCDSLKETFRATLFS
ncbi:MAG: HIT family protein [Pseudomonadota bacterium]